jgi:hypothetical protein
MIGQYLPHKTKVILFIGLKFFHKTWPELPAQHALQLGQRTLAD